MKEAIKMYFLRYILVLSCILKINEALKNCSETHDMLSVCLIGDKNYEDPVPAHLETWLYLNEIIKINGNENSFSIHVELITYWKDPRLALSSGKE